MNMTRPLLVLAGCLAFTPCFAQMDVDQADSLNFHGFHQDKKAAVKVWKERKSDELVDTAPVKAYDQQSATVPVRPQGGTTGEPPSPAVAIAPAENSGKRFEIRERYTLRTSPAMPHSASYVIDALHRQMPALCPGGWQKLEERSEPADEDFYLYYVVQCL